ncbi:bifunctional (p)ppGpp synthetase/guanosine-3',5'-bis(diphosphate) 3'-pyrophosphohydrolase [Candidatus Saccharibacteria bacterium]|nr:bifunctional (p)ppGpp synthetase/guanosine-3',5'-bis(diphosphate) 3'-pyrophosphohydrolase [Candidatus Saccharibacteria bacterium]MBH2007225.1 bifunctional (p)ppGpp synthetase/guanosine-3',5'-bis(diphosphate) 3'-pyrophosphohydrolase [Candidatus Saccharibacteria bacterium]
MKKREVLEFAEHFYDEDQVLELEHAIDYATSYHKGQKRKSGEAYITHPLSVAHNLIDWGMDIDTVLAGVLHDTVEDTDATLDEIENLFGRDVAFLVDGVTKVSQARAGMRDLSSYLPQTKDNLSKLLIAVGQDVRVIIIKLADRLHNMSTLQHMPPDKQQKIARETLEVFAPMADRLGMGRVRMQMEELAFSYLDPKEFKHLQADMRKRLGRSTRKLGIVRTEIEHELDKHGFEFEINGRVKSIYSLYKKLKKVDGNIDDIYDLMALRIIVDSKEDCYRVLGILHGMYQPMIARIKDYIAVPKPNGYQSLHTTVITPTKQIVELQIRTHNMHDYAERGLAASFHYHEQKTTKSYTKSKRGNGGLPAELQWINQMQEVAARLRDGEDISQDQLAIDLFGNRIFVYSPKGDIYNLPEGAFPLDFAYLVHSDIGKHTYSFKVNGNIHAFDKPLSNGDVVEVVTRKLPQAKKAWLEMVMTSHAKSKLRMQLKQLGLIEGISHAAAIIRDKASRRVGTNRKSDR